VNACVEKLTGWTYKENCGWHSYMKVDLMPITPKIQTAKLFKRKEIPSALKTQIISR
jgi:hypothetical protein